MINLVRLEQEIKAIKDFKNDQEEDKCHKPIRVSNFQSNNHIEYESNGDRNKTISFEEYLNKIIPYL